MIHPSGTTQKETDIIVLHLPHSRHTTLHTKFCFQTSGSHSELTKSLETSTMSPTDVASSTDQATDNRP